MHGCVPRGLAGGQVLYEVHGPFDRGEPLLVQAANGQLVFSGNLLNHPSIAQEVVLR